jgi:hypothetical protein
MAFKQEVNVPLILTIGIVSGIMILVIVIGVQAWYQSEEANEMTLKAAQANARALDVDLPDKTFAEIKQGQLDALSADPHWADDKKTRMTMKIDDAMKYIEAHGDKIP